MGKPIDLDVNLNRQRKPPKVADGRVLLRAMEVLNAERQKSGAPLLVMSIQLNQAAQEHSADMEARGYLGAATPEGEPATARVTRTGYQGRSEVLVGMGADTADEAIAEWMKSAGHKRHLVDPSYQHMGIGMADGVWTLVLAAPPVAAMKDVRDIKSRVSELINRERAQAGLLPLGPSDQLATAAQEHSADMAKRDYFSTASPDGVNVAGAERRLQGPQRLLPGQGTGLARRGGRDLAEDEPRQPAAPRGALLRGRGHRGALDAGAGDAVTATPACCARAGRAAPSAGCRRFRSSGRRWACRGASAR